MKRSKPEGLARIQAGGKRSATPAIRYISQRKPRMGGRILPAMLLLSLFLPPLRGFGCSRSSTQGLYPCLCSATPLGFWMLSFLNAGGVPPACGLPPLWGFGCPRSSTQGLCPCLWSATPSGFWMLSFLNTGVVPLPVVCHPFGVKLSRENKTPDCRTD